MKQFFTKEVRIALVTIVAIIVLFAGMNFLKGIIVLNDDVTYKVKMDNINGLSESSPIYADGYRVGVVRNIDYDYSGEQGGIIVSIDVDKDLRIPKGSTAEVTADLMGNLQMNLLLANNPRERVEAGEMIMGALNTGAMGQLAQMVPAIEAMLPKLDSILGSINRLLADPAITAMLHNAEAVSGNLKTTTVELNRLMAGLNRQVPGMMQKADRTLANTEKLTSNLSQVDVAGTMAQVNATLANCKELTDKLNSSEGTLGKFMNDPSVYDNLNSTMRDADSLMIDLKSHPKRYVHFSIFGKKDK